MNKQILISVDREFGSGGRDIAHMLGEAFGIPVYHHNLLRKIGIHESYDLAEISESFDEAPRNPLLSRTVRGLTNSNSDSIARKEFDLLRELAAKGESFVIIGHCGESILKEFGVISFFVTADKKMRVARTMEQFHESEKKAKKRMQKFDKNRRDYHNHYAGHKWFDVRNYDLAINSSRLGVKPTARFLEGYIRLRLGLPQPEGEKLARYREEMHAPRQDSIPHTPVDTPDQPFLKETIVENVCTEAEKIDK